MKNIILIILFVYSFSIKGQNAMPASSININGILIVQQTETSIINFFGNPDSINPEYFNELDNEIYTEYTYGLNHFYFKDGNLIDFSLYDNSLYFHDTTIRVGNSISVIQPFFPISYSNAPEVSYSTNNGFKTILLTMDDDTFSDAFISIYYDTQTNAILAINLSYP